MLVSWSALVVMDFGTMNSCFMDGHGPGFTCQPATPQENYLPHYMSSFHNSRLVLFTQKWGRHENRLPRLAIQSPMPWGYFASFNTMREAFAWYHSCPT